MHEAHNHVDIDAVKHYMRRNDYIKHQAKMAITWGEPCNESPGMSHNHLISLISKMLQLLEELEGKQKGG